MKTISLLLLLLFNCASPGKKEIKKENMTVANILNLVQKNDLPGVEEALKNGAEVNTSDSKKRSLLLISTNDQNKDMANLLVKYGADVNQ